MSLVSRYLEENGIPTVVIANARDIVESAGVARLLFVDFPLGNPCGEPWATEQQRDILEKAFRLLETAAGPRTTVDSGHVWSKGEAWKELVFTDERPFLYGEGHEEWMKRKEKYRQLKQEGKV